MGKLPFMKWFPADWLQDTRHLTPIAKAVWIDLINYMWTQTRRGIWKGSILQLSRLAGVPQDQTKEALLEIQTVASVSIRKDDVTVMSRRILRDEKDRKLNAFYQKVHRSKLRVRDASGECKRKKSEVRSQTSDVKQQQQGRENGNGNAHPPPVSRFQKPTPQEVSGYAASIGYELNGQHFCDVYESKGWLVGKSPMKDWKASVRTWKRKSVEQLSTKEPINVH